MVDPSRARGDKKNIYGKDLQYIDEFIRLANFKKKNLYLVAGTIHIMFVDCSR